MATQRAGIRTATALVAGACALLYASSFFASPAVADAPPAPAAPPTANRPEGLNAGGPQLDVIVDALDVSKGVLPVHLRLYGLSPRASLSFKEMGVNKEYEYSEVRFTDDQNRPVGFKKNGQKYKLDLFEGTEVHAYYLAKPGGLGRHGHQGFMGSDYAVFDGRAFLQPTAAMDLGRVRVRYDTPEGWTEGTPFRRDGDWHVVDTYRADLAWEALFTSCVGLGNFDEHVTQYGQMPLRVYSYGGFSDDHKALLVDKTNRMAKYFHEVLRFDLQAPFSLVWVPKEGEPRVFGGAYSNGACYEQPTDRFRNWLLLGHRFAHPMNKYNPSGLVLRDARDHWFTEAWASYIEVISTHGAGISEDQGHFKEHLRRYHRDRDTLDLVLADEATNTDHEVSEHIHYYKSPLAVRMLDHWMRQRSGKTMEEFMAYLYPKYGFLKAPVPLREELEAFTGHSFDDFHALFIDQESWMLPVGPETLSAEQVAAAQAKVPAAWVGEQAITADYLFFLARRGGFERLADLEAFLVEEVQRRATLSQMGITLMPQQLLDNVGALDPVVHRDLVLAEAAYDMSLAPAEALAKLQPPASGCNAPEPFEPPAVSLRPNMDTPEGRVFAEALAAESVYAESRLSEGLSSLQLRTGAQEGIEERPLRLSTWDTERLVFFLHWKRPPARAEVDLMVGDKVHRTKKVFIDPGWSRTWSSFELDDRPKGDLPLRVRVRAGDKVLLERTFWQRKLDK